ncbi:MAG: hypothetical protein JSU94_18030 [Phycisphaerales bacterium]|nr:MAG: hypothetical protein JSU94_18030 [Phycisphaerales bacterium]
MFEKLRSRATMFVLTGLIVLAGSTVKGDWSETFDGDQLDVATWDFAPLPDVTKTFTHTIITDPNGNKYLSLDETTSEADNGSQFGAGYIEEAFTDVRVGAIVNVTGDASRAHHGLLARLDAIIDPDGSVTGIAPGFFPRSVYVMHINWENGPANLRIDIEKVVNVSNIMQNAEELGLDLYVPGLNHARSYYAELDVLGSDPTYVTGRLYEYVGGPLVAKTETMVDTSGNDPWEEDVGSDAPFLSGDSGIFAQNQNETPPGYHTTFDDVFSTSTPAAVMPSPADGATDAEVDAELSWIEASSATSRQLWFGKAGAMEMVDPAPAGASYTPGNLEMGQTYQWRVDQIGPAGTVDGLVWTFTTAEYLSVEDFGPYADDAALRAAWPHNIGGGFQYVFLATDSAGVKSMQLDVQNQHEPFFTEATRTLDAPQDWSTLGVETVSLTFVGRDDNAEHPLYVTLEDAAGQSLKVEHPFTFACQSRIWRQWDIALEEFSAAGVNLSSIAKVTVGMGSGEPSAQTPDEDRDAIFIGSIRLRPPADGPAVTP